MVVAPADPPRPTLPSPAQDTCGAAKLARALDASPQTVTRIVDLRHATKIDTLAEAFRAIGKHGVFHLRIVPR